MQETEGELRRRNRHEGAELSAEAKENQAEEAEKKMAARERIEQTSKEVKNTQTQMQHIMANMTQVGKSSSGDPSAAAAK